jgi:hypothetical protein
MEVKRKFSLNEMGKNFDMMFSSNTKFHASTFSLSNDSSVPPPDIDACTCILFFGIRTPKEILCLVPHSQFNSVNVASSSLTITSRKFANEKDPFHSFSNTCFQYAPCLSKKNTLNHNLYHVPFVTLGTFWP